MSKTKLGAFVVDMQLATKHTIRLTVTPEYLRALAATIEELESKNTCPASSFYCCPTVIDTIDDPNCKVVIDSKLRNRSEIEDLFAKTRFVNHAQTKGTSCKRKPKR